MKEGNITRNNERNTTAGRTVIETEMGVPVLPLKAWANGIAGVKFAFACDIRVGITGNGQ